MGPVFVVLNHRVTVTFEVEESEKVYQLLVEIVQLPDCVVLGCNLVSSVY